MITQERQKYDRRLVERFSDNYKDYMQKVPRINFLAGVIRLIQNRKNEKGKEQNFKLS